MASSRLDRRGVLRLGGASAIGLLASPAILRAQDGPLVLGHLTPRTGFLGPLGDYAVMGIEMAAEQINANGGILGRQVELLMEDSVNPQTASTKADRMIQRDNVAAIIGEISSASALTIGQTVERNRRFSSTPARTPTRCAARTASGICFMSKRRTSCM